MQTLKSIFIATIVFLLMDGLWIGVIAKQLYMTQMGDFLRIQNNTIIPNFYAAAVVYIALISGILIFVIPKANGNPLLALMWGALFGFVTYATYDFTNLAVVKNWPIGISIIDVVWGCVICGVTSFVTTWLK
ncbi:MAG: DUF2177 family protein [Gammaproteobacteria bacterium]|nr:DUF2177 family protein [Gammaproteobacteria bacterium]